LVDSAAANHAAYSRALVEVGAQLGPEDVAHAAAGRHWREFLPALLRAAGVDCDPAMVARRKGDLYREMLGKLRLNTTLLSLADSVRPRVKTVLVTTASAESVQAILGYFELEGAFDFVITGDDVARHKPNPEAYQLALQRLRLEPEECLAFEDSDVGVASAEAAGVAVVRVAFAER
jgi:HAD superfamily hydrolase (TIGR01509 family)